MPIMVELEGVDAPAESDIIDRAPFGIYVVDADFRITLANPIARSVFAEVAGPIVGRNFDEVLHQLRSKDHADEVAAVFRRTLETGVPHVREGDHVDSTGSRFYEWRVDRIRLLDGRNGVVCYFRDITAQALTHQKILEDEERFRALVHASAQIVWSTGPSGEVEEDLPLWRAYTGQSLVEMRGWGWLNAVHPDDRAQIAERGERGLARGCAYEMEFRVRHRNGDWRWMVVRCVPLKRADGGVRGWIGMSTDVTDRKNAEQTQQLLISELNHRVKNTLASVQSILHHTLRQTRDPELFAESLSGRIQAIARMHTLLSSGAWQGAYLREIVRDQLATVPDSDRRLVLAGPLVRLDPPVAVNLALVLHELSTNSLKYGAFARPGGSVEVTWSIDRGRLMFTWRDRGGLPLKEPVRRGFGSLLIEQSARSLGGSAQITSSPDGITWTIELPLSVGTVAPHEPTLSAPTASAALHDHNLSGKRVLVVEDEPLVVLDVVGALESAGAEVASAATAERALCLVKDGHFDAALIDANLCGRPVEDVAAALSRGHVPFVFLTGYGRESLPQGYDTVPMLAKPFSEDALIVSVASLLARPDFVRP